MERSGAGRKRTPSGDRILPQNLAFLEEELGLLGVNLKPLFGTDGEKLLDRVQKLCLVSSMYEETSSHCSKLSTRPWRASCVTAWK